VTQPLALTFAETDLDAIATRKGRVAVVIDPEGGLSVVARRVNKLTRGALARLTEAESFTKKKAGDVITLAWPQGLVAEALDVVLLPRRAETALLRKTGA
jgi:leucyl aminopeptidase